MQLREQARTESTAIVQAVLHKLRNVASRHWSRISTQLEHDAAELRVDG